MMQDIIIIGYGGHGRVLADSIQSTNRYHIVGYTDKGEKKGAQIPYLGTDNDLEKLYAEGITNAVIGIGFMGNSYLRDRVFEKCSKIGFSLPIIIDADASVSPSSIIGEGTYIGKRAVVNSHAIVGRNCIINTGSIVEHDCRVGDYTHIAVGAVVCGKGKIGNHCLIGANATVIQQVEIGDCTIVGAGAVVLSDIKEKSKVAGNPCKEI